MCHLVIKMELEANGIDIKEVIYLTDGTDGKKEYFDNIELAREALKAKLRESYYKTKQLLGLDSDSCSAH